MPTAVHQADHASAERFAQRRWLIVLLFTLAFLVYAGTWCVSQSSRWTPGTVPDARTVGAISGAVWGERLLRTAPALLLTIGIAVPSSVFSTLQRHAAMLPPGDE